MVWSNGVCPSCRKPVVMYEWKVDPFTRPWKLTCPRCEEIFPKNDFGAFYRSGLDASGWFDPARADRALLVNAEHPGESDPLRNFGVDDGNGFIQGEEKWRFIAAYLIYGDWKRYIVAGVRSLAAAFVVTEDREYSRRAIVLLDRVADIFPEFDFCTQGEVYEVKGNHGYVSVWHDANTEQSDLAIAYDQVFDGMKEDAELVAFLSEKARKYGLKNQKATGQDIQRNIEDRILRDAISHREKIHTNFPGMHTLVITMRAIVDWPECKEEIYGYWADLLKRTTAVDGITGEKGLASYARVTLRWAANALSLFMLSDSKFIETMVKRVPTFAKTYRFHIDTWCADGSYYPNEGDGTFFGARAPNYVGLAMVNNNPADHRLTKMPGARPSMDRLMFECAMAAGDLDLLRVMVRENGGKFEGCVFDLTLTDLHAVETTVRELLSKHGAQLRLGCVDLRQWHIAILRSGAVGKERSLWMDYDAGGYHSHQDAMNIGLFAHGMDLMPDAGYPPVQFGGWDTDKAKWYYHAAAHNTVMVDGRTQRTDGGKPVAGETRVWTQSPTMKVMKMSAPAVYGVSEYERTLMLIDIGEDDFYVVDRFRVAGGKEHAKFVHSNFGPMTTSGLSLKKDEVFEKGLQKGILLRNFSCDEKPTEGWSADWAIEDRYGYLPAPKDLHLRYTDFTLEATAWTHEGWYVQGGMIDSVNEQWIPRVMVKRTGDTGLTSNFVGLLEPYVGKRKIVSMRRLRSERVGAHAATHPETLLEISLADGRRDLVILDAAGALKKEGIAVAGFAALIRYDAQGRVSRIVTSRAWHVAAGELVVNLEAYTQSQELEIQYGSATPRVIVHSSDASERFGIDSISIGGVSVLNQIG